MGSAVMLNAKLKPGVNLMHGGPRPRWASASSAEAQPEVYRWTDNGSRT